METCNVKELNVNFNRESKVMVEGQQESCHIYLCKEKLERVRLGSIRNKKSWNNANKRSFGSYSHSGILGFYFRYSAPESIYSYPGLIPMDKMIP